MYKDGKQYDKFILNGKTYDKFYLNNKQYGGGYVPFATPILDIDFQNNFIDKSPSALTMVQGKGLPTFGLSGRKAGEYCVNFNSLQSIKTTTNLPLNSDKVCIKFWMKTSQSGNGMISELSQKVPSNNGFYIVTNETQQGISVLNSNGSSFNDKSGAYNITANSWLHVIVAINRANSATNEIKIYIEGLPISLIIMYANNELSQNFINNILYIGQRAGTSVGYVGSLMKYQVFNQAPTDEQAMEMYLNDL